MTKAKILIFSRDPGGANTVIPLVKPLEEKGYKVRLFGKDVSLEKYLKAGICGLDIMDFIKDVNLKNLEEFLIKESPDFIVTGTSSDFTERYIWKAGEKLGIPSFAILDQWINYGLRFSKYSLPEIEEYKQDKTHPYLPSKVLVMDDYAKQEAIKDGLEPSRILVTGQPYFETILEEKKKISPERIRLIRETLGIGKSDFLITFASEPVSTDYNKSSNPESYWGYTEHTTFQKLISNINKISTDFRGNFSVVVRLHPREDAASYNDVISSFNNKLNVITDKNLHSWELILASDLICGMSSMFLIESVVLGKPTLSIQIGLKRENPFVLDRMGILKSITASQLLIKYLKSIIIEDNVPICEFNYINNAKDNILLEMEKYLCRN